MSIKLDNNLIKNFRNKVNKSSVFRSYYRNKDNKNMWNIICSAMDWIDVTVEGLPSIRLNYKDGFGVDHIESLNLMQYIVSIDILIQAIIQLFRVLNSSKDYPLINDRSVFKQPLISDDKYFKQIRAVFGTHQVNLDSLDGIPKEKGERFFASWPAKGIIGKFDYTVNLYSNNPDKDELNHFGIVISEINEYAVMRYNLLAILTKKIEQILLEHRTLNINELIESSSDPVKQLHILFAENKKRYGEEDGYSYEINYILQMLEVDIGTNDTLIVPTIEEYRNYLIQQIPSIKDALQEMGNVDLPHWTWHAYGYEFEKIYSYLYSRHPIGQLFYEELIACNVLPEYLYEVSNYVEKQLVLDSILYKLASSMGKRITFKELKESNFCR